MFSALRDVVVAERVAGEAADVTDTSGLKSLGAELLHRDRVIHQLIDGDLGTLIEARRFVGLEVRLIPVQGRKDVASAGSHGFHRYDGGDRNVVKDRRTIAGEQHGGPD